MIVIIEYSDGITHVYRNISMVKSNRSVQPNLQLYGEDNELMFDLSLDDINDYIIL